MSVIEGRNFSGKVGPPDIPLADEYILCNFSQPDCIDDGGVKKGIRLFPGDDTPRIFTSCNMKNCEPPPGSTYTDCNGAIVEKRVHKDSDTVTIDGQSVELENYVNKIHGYFKGGSYTYFSTPKEIPIDREDE